MTKKKNDIDLDYIELNKEYLSITQDVSKKITSKDTIIH